VREEEGGRRQKVREDEINGGTYKITRHSTVIQLME
jgi:hypothetical protein